MYHLLTSNSRATVYYENLCMCFMLNQFFMYLVELYPVGENLPDRLIVYGFAENFK